MEGSAAMVNMSGVGRGGGGGGGSLGVGVGLVLCGDCGGGGGDEMIEGRWAREAVDAFRTEMSQCWLWTSTSSMTCLCTRWRIPISDKCHARLVCVWEGSKKGSGCFGAGKVVMVVMVRVKDKMPWALRV